MYLQMRKSWRPSQLLIPFVYFADFIQQPHSTFSAPRMYTGATPSTDHAVTASLRAGDIPTNEEVHFQCHECAKGGSVPQAGGGFVSRYYRLFPRRWQRTLVLRGEGLKSWLCCLINLSGYKRSTAYLAELWRRPVRSRKAPRTGASAQQAGV